MRQHKPNATNSRLARAAATDGLIHLLQCVLDGAMEEGAAPIECPRAFARWMREWTGVHGKVPWSSVIRSAKWLYTVVASWLYMLTPTPRAASPIHPCDATRVMRAPHHRKCVKEGGGGVGGCSEHVRCDACHLPVLVPSQHRAKLQSCTLCATRTFVLRLATFLLLTRRSSRWQQSVGMDIMLERAVHWHAVWIVFSKSDDELNAPVSVKLVRISYATKSSSAGALVRPWNVPRSHHG